MGTLWSLQPFLAFLCLSVTSAGRGEQRDPTPASKSAPAAPCPPARQCGCQHEGRHYPVGSEFWADETCSTRCVCMRQGGLLQCSQASCPRGSFCGIEKDIRACLKASKSICLIYGDPSYYTFDKGSYHFMGNCTYILAERCATRESVPYFKVVVKNGFKEESPQTYVNRVLIQAYGHRVEIHKDMGDQVMLDEMWRRLPVSYANGSVTITKSGQYISLKTEFQLIVSYDTVHSVLIQLPALFFNTTCGMCGNFNGNKEDDFLMPNGEQAKGPNELGNSWQVVDAEQSSPCRVPDVGEPCTPDQTDLYGTDEFCGVLISGSGPFQACHPTISPQSFLQSCLRDMCAFPGHQEQLCNTLNVYSDACQRSGVALRDWREEAFCPFLCPSQSEHKVCTSACPATCTNLLAPAQCDRPCVEGCECHQGFVFSGGQCVPVEDCGCLVGNEYYEKGESFVQEKCRGQCRCTGNGTLSCTSADICEKGQVCKAQNGILGCYLPGTDTCHIFGGSHHITFDGSLYHVEGRCSYIAVETCTRRAAEEFSVTVTYERGGRQTLTVLKSVMTSYKDLDITLWRNKTISVNGCKVALHGTLPPGMAVEENPPFIALSFPFGLWVEFDGDQQLFLKVAENLKGHVCGLCGHYSGTDLDDFLKSDGEKDSEEIKFASSWMVMGEEDWQCDPELKVPEGCNTESAKRHIEICERISDLHGPFEGCHWKVDPENYFKSCLLDQCNFAGSMQHCRSSLQAYAAACKHEGVHLPNWWRETLCDPPTNCNFSCSFDTNLCLWVQSVHDNFDWILLKGSTPSRMTGPSYDHTTGEGHYVYIEGDSALEGEVAHLISPTCTPQGPLCFRFWYYMYGTATLMSLRVYVAPEGEGRKLLWIATGRKGDHWLNAKVTVHHTGRLQIIVEGMRGEDFLCDVAVDDISVTPGPCVGNNTLGVFRPAVKSDRGMTPGRIFGGLADGNICKEPLTRAY